MQEGQEVCFFSSFLAYTLHTFLQYLAIYQLSTMSIYTIKLYLSHRFCYCLGFFYYFVYVIMAYDLYISPYTQGKGAAYYLWFYLIFTLCLYLFINLCSVFVLNLGRIRI